LFISIEVIIFVFRALPTPGAGAGWWQIVFLSVYNTAMLMPFIGMYYGLHQWTGTEAVFG